MSRIGKKPVPVPANVKIAITGRKVSVTGPKGTLTMEHHPLVKVTWTESEKAVACTIAESDAENRAARAQWGTTRALIRNMIEGVTNGYEKALEVNGVGWTPTMQGTKLKLVVGLASPIFLEVPKGLSVTVEKQLIKVNGPDRQLVGQFAAQVRAKRKPEPYNGKGIKYTTETIRRKQGKQFGA